MRAAQNESRPKAAQAGRVCIVGAGAAGMAAAHAISSAGLVFDWFEAGSDLGGIWRYGNDSGSSIYASLITNTSQLKMQWFGFPMPKAKNDYLTHQEVLHYLTSFTAHAHLETKITLSTRVTNIELMAGNRFRVHAQNLQSEKLDREYGAVVLATGYHSTPKWPKIAGLFKGSIMHACDYRTPDIFTGKRVVVVGFGASGADIACDAADIAETVILSTRSGGYLLPRYVNGKPRDERNPALLALAPVFMRKLMWRIMLMRRTLSPKVRAALERDARPFRKPAVLNDRLPALIESDRILVRPAIERFEGDRVRFSDASSNQCDLLICATGYELDYSFFSSELLEQNNSFEDRYLRVIPPNQPGLYFLGHVSVVGPFFPIFERQALWVADLLSGQCIPPPVSKMRHLARKQSRAACIIYPDAARQGDTVDYYPYLRALKREHAIGRNAASVSALNPDPQLAL